MIGYYREYMVLLVIICLFIFGLIVGSFINVVIYRTIHGEQWVKGRSRCDHCKHVIAWYDNIPLLSFIVLRGKCRYCHKKIALQHFVIELMTGVLFVWWYVIGFAFFRLTQTPHLVIQPLFWLVVGVFLLIIFVTDWLYQIIPDYANLTLGLLALAYRLYLTGTGAMQHRDFWLAVGVGLGLTAFLGALWAITKGRGMGFGDVKFAMVMGVLLGWPRGLVAMFLAFVVGAVFGIIMIGLRLKKLRERIAFGLFLILGTAIALLWGNSLWDQYMRILGI
jgi:prepilin signal peptidase PulO-like enzyme (type II secretory pathway)